MATEEELPMPTSLTVRLLMQGKEVGSIIGKGGDHVKAIREESGARINISDGSVPERIVTITGSLDCVMTAFAMICSKFEEDLRMASSSGSVPPITLRVIVPATQCGSIIGKGGQKINEIRDSTGASVQVASEMLPGSTERAVTISGKSEAIQKCVDIIAKIMLENPAKGPVIPYRPSRMPTPLPVAPQMTAAPPVLLNGQLFTIQGNIAMPFATHHDMSRLAHMGMCVQDGKNKPTPLLVPCPVSPPGLLSPVSSSAKSHTQEMTIPNELIGCIIGRGGAKINEIRQASGANIKIGNLEEGSMERHVTITGSPDQIQMAQFLINTRLTSELGNLLLPPLL